MRLVAEAGVEGHGGQRGVAGDQGAPGGPGAGLPAEPPGRAAIGLAETAREVLGPDAAVPKTDCRRPTEVPAEKWSSVASRNICQFTFELSAGHPC